MPAAIFNSSAVKILKDILRTKSGTDIITTTTNPLTVGYVGAIGSMLLKTDTAQVFKKWGITNTDWIEVLDTMAATNINYCLNGLAIKDTTGWSTYADAAKSSPTDGTGGSPSVTIARNTITPLYGIADFVITKDAANRQGQGVAYTVGTFYPAHFAKVMKVTFDYKCSTGFSFANNDLTAWAYDITNSLLIPIQPNYFDGSGKFVGEFQSTASGASYRILFHIATTNATAWTVNIDNIFVGPQDITYANLGDRQYDLTVTGTNWTTTRAIGIPYKTLDGVPRLRYNIVGTVTSGSRSSYAVDLYGVVFKNAVNYNQPCTAETNTSITSVIGYATANTSTLTAEHATGTTTDYSFAGDLELESMPTWAIDTTPIQLGTAETTRAVNARYSAGNAQTITLGGWSLIDFYNKEYDSHNAVTTGASWKYTCKVTGKYDVYVYLTLNPIAWQVSNVTTLQITKNNSVSFSIDRPIVVANFTDYFIMRGQATLDLIAGDFFDVRALYAPTGGGTTTLFNNTGYNYITVVRQSGQAAIAASESVFNNDNLLTDNHLGSENSIVDKSVSGRGIFLRRPDGTLREICIDNSDNIVIYSL